ncbi:MAG TPA: peptide-methionine (S)-S-oxide reductase MsrA [Gemmatimonadaceae bacterium]|nr:peptide-methionine (S)-S-oxide reductase MsrA [Gemmatimonadaceae bacterium]
MMRSVSRGNAVFGGLMVVAGLLFAQRLTAATRDPVSLPAPARDELVVNAKSETAVFAGGCFWGIQSVFQHIKGVVSATSGYAGGTIDHPSYEVVSTGVTGHAESVRVVFDPSQVTYGQLLRVFFSVAHDPTQWNHQEPDVGPQYRSALFYMSDEQKKTAEAYIDQLNKSHAFSKPIVTQVAPLKAFFAAEAYHQNYAELHPTQPYIAIYDAPKVANLKKQFPDLYSEKLAAHE